jgi:hypothetical protein
MVLIWPIWAKIGQNLHVKKEISASGTGPPYGVEFAFRHPLVCKSTADSDGMPEPSNIEMQKSGNFVPVPTANTMHTLQIDWFLSMIGR